MNASPLPLSRLPIDTPSSLPHALERRPVASPGLAYWASEGGALQDGPQGSTSRETAGGPGERLHVNLTLLGDTFALRYQAKASGYSWQKGFWCREISTPLVNRHPAELRQAEMALQRLVQTEANRFTCATSTDEARIS